MNEYIQHLDAHNETVDALEAVAKQDLVDEDGFILDMKASLLYFEQYINDSAFLDEQEKTHILSTIDSEISGMFDAVIDECESDLEKITLAYVDEVQFKYEQFHSEALGLTHKLLASVERTISTSQDFLVTDAELSAIIELISETESPQSLHFDSTDNLIDYAKSLPLLAGDVLMRYNGGSEPYFLKKVDESRVLVYTVNSPRIKALVSSKDLHVPGTIEQALDEAFVDSEDRRLRDSLHQKNIEIALGESSDELTQVEIGWEDQSDVQKMAIESAYNMGMKATFHVKMQLLVKKLSDLMDLPLDNSFTLDGDWGPASKTALKALFSKEGISYNSEDSYANFNQLRQLHFEAFPNDDQSPFLTVEEINHPDYKFDNKGVYRGLKVTKLKEKLIDSEFNINSIRTTILNGVADDNAKLSERVMSTYPTVLKTLKKLTNNQDIIASILATMILENGISSGFDDWGIGRSDRKDYAARIQTLSPRFASLAGDVPLVGRRIEISSAGPIQINYKTAQGIVKDRAGQYIPRDIMTQTLNDNVEFSTVMAFLVYQDNIDTTRQIMSRCDVLD